MKLTIEIDLKPNMEELLIDHINEFCNDWFNKKPVLQQHVVSRSDAAFVKGYACAVANLIRDHGMCTEAKDLFNAGCGSIAQLEAQGVDSYDIEVLRQHFG